MQLTLALILMIVHPDGFVADQDFRNATVISATAVEIAMHEAAPDRVSDQPLSYVESAEGRVSIGVVHRPVIAPRSPIDVIQHHQQSEVYRIMAGKGVLITSKSMTDNAAIDPEGFVVHNLMGPSDRGVIIDIENSQPIAAGDIVIIPAGVAHGFSEISEAITYMVVRIDPERLVALK